MTTEEGTYVIPVEDMVERLEALAAGGWVGIEYAIDHVREGEISINARFVSPAEFEHRFRLDPSRVTVAIDNDLKADLDEEEVKRIETAARDRALSLAEGKGRTFSVSDGAEGSDAVSVDVQEGKDEDEDDPDDAGGGSS